MNFDIKDVKSWYNRHDVKVGDKGYVANGISQFRELNIDDAKCGKVTYIDDNWHLCFKSDLDTFTLYAFFLPLKAVKKEKKYRPFKTINELEKTLNKVNRSAHQFMRVGNDIFIRDKNQMTHLMITRIDRDVKTNEVINVNGMSPIYLFNNYEIRVGAEWVPFGVEEND